MEDVIGGHLSNLNSFRNLVLIFRIEPIFFANEEDIYVVDELAYQNSFDVPDDDVGVAEGIMMNDKMEGYQILKKFLGIEISKGVYRGGKQEGIWNEYTEDNLSARGLVVNDLQEGPWTMYYPSGAVHYERYFLHNVGVGIETHYFEDGEIEEVIDNDNNHKITYYPTGGKKAEGFFGDFRLKNGLWTYWYPNGMRKSTVYYSRNLKNGDESIWYENGIIKEQSTYVEGKLDGIFRLFYDNGRIQKEINYENGIRNGFFAIYYPNKQVKQLGQYENNIIVGKWYYFKENGTLWMIETYENGIKTGVELIQKRVRKE